jgi:hypothetical protein
LLGRHIAVVGGRNGGAFRFDLLGLPSFWEGRGGGRHGTQDWLQAVSAMPQKIRKKFFIFPAVNH